MRRSMGEVTTSDPVGQHHNLMTRSIMPASCSAIRFLESYSEGRARSLLSGVLSVTKNRMSASFSVVSDVDILEVKT